VSAAEAMVAAVGVLCLLNLVLMLGIVRRLREHEEKLARPVPAADASDEPTIPLGSRPAEFAAVDSTAPASGRTRCAVGSPWWGSSPPTARGA
jgi:hypothetical protein